MHLNTVNRGYPTYSKRVFAYTELRIYTGEHLKRHTAGVLCFKSLPIQSVGSKRNYSEAAL